MQKAALLMYAIYPFKSKKLHITVSGILIERNWFKMFELLRISQYLATPFSHCKPLLTTWSTTVALISSDMHLCSWPLLPLPLFCLCTFPPCILTPLLPLVCWPWSFSVCSSIVRICNSCVVLCLYAFQMKVHEMHLWAISNNWFIIGWFIFSSLVKVKIHLHNLWYIYKKSNVQKICFDSLWQLDQPFCI